MENSLDTLEEYFGRQAEAVPTAITTPEAYYEFSADTLPLPPEELTTGRMYIGRGISEYDEFFAIDQLIFNAHKETLRQLALLILAVVFHLERKAVRVSLTHPASAFATLTISCDGQSFSRWEVLRIQAVSFTYSPADALRYPWHDLPLSPSELPCFYLRSDPLLKAAQPADRQREPDMVAGFGSDRGCVRLAELLLNLGRPDCAENDIRLEAEAGWRGVGRKSVEARFVTPGNYMWDPAQWPSSQ